MKSMLLAAAAVGIAASATLLYLRKQLRSKRRVSALQSKLLQDLDHETQQTRPAQHAMG